ncbi:MAG: hypothetical protein JXB18_09085, partial [Sedimentisphaerales bacterium]|nr:hypothetical protein [Sedimentisphaerales bacterium]
AHYDNVIGAMWIHPAACQPPSGTVAHEFAHALQCQSFIEYPGTGFQHYSSGFFWEAHANFMMLQCYPDNWNGVDLVNFMNHQHFHYSSTRHRYNNMLFKQYIEDKRGIEMVNRLWRESDADTEHPLQTYMRLTGMTQPQLNDEFGEYAMKNVNFDYSVGARIRYEFANRFALNYLTRRFTMLEPMSGQANAYKVPYYMAPQDYGYNIIQLDPDSPTATIDMKFYGQRNDPAGGAEYRFGFVALNGLTSRHSELYAASGGMEIPASFTMQANETELYLVVLGAPAEHHNYNWEEGWPKYYRYPWQIQITGATPFVNNHKYTAGSYHPKGGGFVANTATVAPTAYVGPNAVVLGNSRVQGNARIEDMASVVGGAVVKDKAIVRHAGFAVGGTIQDSAVLEESAAHFGGILGGTYVGGGDATGHADCSSGYYRQEPNGNNGRTACDGLTTHPANVDVNPAFPDYIFNGAPGVDAGDDIVTWLVGGTVTEILNGALITDDGIPAAAATVWTVDPTTDITVVSLASLTTDVTITAVGTYTLTLTADDTEKIGADTMKIRVYTDACDAAKAENGYTTAVADARGDFDYNCMVDLDDFSTLASAWLVSFDLNDLAQVASEWLVSSEYVKP